KSVLSFRAAQGISFDTATGRAENGKPGLLVWGRLEGGQMILEPAFKVTTPPSDVTSGPFTWEARDARGQVVTRVPFQMFEVADMENQEPQHFAFVVPMDDATMNTLDSVRVI